MSSYVTRVVIQGDDKTQGALASASRGIQQYGKAAAAANKKVQASSRASRGAIQQVGYQAQDIAVQLQAGQNPFLVLSQQGSQVASIFGPGGAVAGAFIAIAGIIGMNLLPRLFETSESLADISSKAKELNKNLNDMGKAQVSARIFDIRQKIDELKESNVSAKDGIEGLNSVFNKMTKSTKELTAEEVAYNGQIANNNQQIALYQEELEKLLAWKGKGQGVESFVDTDEANKNLEAGIKLYEQRQKLLEKLVTPLQQLERLQASYDKAVQDGLISEMEALQLKALAEQQYLKSLPKKKEEVDLTKKQAEAYERLKRSLDPAYAAYQSYYEAVTLINNSSAKQSEKTTMVAVAYAKLYEAITPVKEKLDETTEALEWGQTGIEKYQESIKDVAKSLDDAAVNAVGGMEDALVDLVSGTATVEDAFKNMARSIIKDLIRIQIQQSIMGPLSSLIGSAFGNVGTAMKYGTNVGSQQTAMLQAQEFSGGGYTGSGARSGGIDGKGGFPAILHPNETVVDHAKGQSLGEGVTIVQNINVTTGVQQTVRAEIQNLLPSISEAAKAAVADSRMRGGSFSKALVGS